MIGLVVFLLVWAAALLVAVCNLRAMALYERATAAYRRHDIGEGERLQAAGDRWAPWIRWRA